MRTAQIALAWHLQQRQATAPLVSVTKLSHFDGAIARLDATLTPGECA